MTDAEKKRLKKQLVGLLTPEAVDEAYEILTNCSERWLNSFKEEMKKKSGNTACCAIDFAKMQLVRDGKMENTGHFGNGWDDILTEEDYKNL